MGIGKLTKPKAKRVETVLGIDASTNSLAFCLYGPEDPVRWGEIAFEGKNVFDRLSDAQEKVRAVAPMLKADMIVFESAVYVQNKKTVILLAYSFGSVVSALMTAGATVEEASPLVWQRFINNNPLTKTEKEKIMKENPGKSKSWYSNKYREFRKARTAKWVEDTYGIIVDNDNVTDAIAISHYGWNTYGSSKN